MMHLSIGTNRQRAPSPPGVRPTCESGRKKTQGLTFHVDLSRRGVSAVEIGSKARVAPGVFLESLCDDERMQLAVGDDLNVGAVLQLLALTKPPVENTWTEKGSVEQQELIFFLMRRAIFIRRRHTFNLPVCRSKDYMRYVCG